MDNAPGYFDAFERDNIHVVFFPPNCTNWKQPSDMGIIAALKKQYKYLYLKDILDFYELDEQLKQGKENWENDYDEVEQEFPTEIQRTYWMPQAM
jgi:hypothetical protein